MTWLALAIFLIAASALVAARVARGRRRRGTPPPVVPPELVARLTAARRAFADAAPWRPASDPGAPAVAAAIEAALIAGDPGAALALAESALASSAAPDRDPQVRVWLAWALCAGGQPRAALDQLAAAGAWPLPPAGVRPSLPTGAPPPAPAGERLSPPALGPLAIYVAARAAHLHFEHGHGAAGAVPPLITTGDLAIVTLGRGRGSAAWLAGATDLQLSAAEVRAALAEHRDLTARCLAGALDALDRAPGFTDAAYLAARLAVKAGLLAEARALFDAIAPRMIGRPDAGAFERDRRDLADPTSAVAAAKHKPPAKGRRPRSLRVLP